VNPLPSRQQTAAINVAVSWYRHRRREQQVFLLLGYAGTGKTTVIHNVVSALGLAPKARGRPGGVLFMASTAKAAQVMSRKGNPASTIHSLIYRVADFTPAAVERAEAELAELRIGLGQMQPGGQAVAVQRIRRLERRLARLHQPVFLLNEMSVVHDADLIVLDEVSMVGQGMAADLLSFGKPVIAVGDPGQLPPVMGVGAFTEAEPDVMLTEVHRQAGESAILRLATMARQRQEIPYGEYGRLVRKLPRATVDAQQLLEGSQVICGRNDTRLRLNAAMRRAAGFAANYPTGAGEKVICLKNCHDLGLVNGMFLELAEVRDEGPLAFSAAVTTEDGKKIAGRHRFQKGHFDAHLTREPDRLRWDRRERRDLLVAEWGYAITCHKAQGSQWESVVVCDDRLGRTAEDRARWLYTAITRAERGLVIFD
jgi:exodeoxyribonuclease-5